MGLGGLLLALAAIWLISSGTAGLGEPANKPTTEEEVQRVSVQEAYAAHQDGSALFLDVRGAESYDAAHIPGALNIPLEELPTRINELSKDDWILTYCT